jgi:hypothetical protein
MSWIFTYSGYDCFYLIYDPEFQIYRICMHRYVERQQAQRHDSQPTREILQTTAHPRSSHLREHAPSVPTPVPAASLPEICADPQLAAKNLPRKPPFSKIPRQSQAAQAQQTMVRRRKQSGQNDGAGQVSSTFTAAVSEAAEKSAPQGKATEKDSMSAALRRQPVWLLLAVTSGACAAFNGVFAKLYVFPTHLPLPRPSENSQFAPGLT